MFLCGVECEATRRSHFLVHFFHRFPVDVDLAGGARGQKFPAKTICYCVRVFFAFKKLLLVFLTQNSESLSLNGLTGIFR